MQDPVHITSFHIQKINLRGGPGEKNIQQFFLNIKLAENVNRKYLINSTKAVLSFSFKLFPEYLELPSFHAVQSVRATDPLAFNISPLCCIPI